MRSQRAFTLVELLVVIAIVGILLAMLLPLLGKARAAAMKTVCAARLRDLSMASIQFAQEHKKYPAPGRDPTAVPGLPQGAAIPHRIETRLVNELGTYFKQAIIPDNLPVGGLSPVFQCPFVEDIDQNRGPFLAGTSMAYYYTGYTYLARLNEGSATVERSGPLISLNLPLNVPVSLSLQVPTLLKPERSAGVKPGKRAAIWADDLHFTQTPVSCWTYWHRKKGATGVVAVPLSVTDCRPVLGQNVGFTDGSVQWVPSGEIKLDVSSPSLLDLNASFKLPGVHVWWF